MWSNMIKNIDDIQAKKVLDYLIKEFGKEYCSSTLLTSLIQFRERG